MKQLHPFDLLAGVLIAVVAVALWLNVTRLTITSDEKVYAPVGIYAIQVADRVINNEHPPLMKLLGGSFALLTNLTTLPALELVDDQWAFGEAVWFQSGNDTDRMLALSRFPFALLTIALLVSVYWFFSSRFGRLYAIGALMALALNPNLVVHGSFTVNDALLAVTTWGAMLAGWLVVEQPTIRRFVGWGIAVAALALSKYSALIILPFAVLVPAGYLLARSKRRWQTVGTIALAAVVSLTTIWGTYLFIERRAIVSDQALTVQVAHWSLTFERPWTKAIAVPFGRYAEGFNSVRNHDQAGHKAYLNGQIREDGFPSYFAWATWYKVPTVLVVLMVAGMVAAIKQRRPFELWCSVAATAFFSVASLSSIQTGIRYLLPVFVLLAPAVGWWFNQLARSRSGTSLRAWVLVLAMVAGLEVTLGGGFTVGYFSPLSGGPAIGYQHLADSNIDWGQEVAVVEEFAEEQRIERPVYSYFTGENPSYRRFDYVPIEPLSCGDLLAYDWIITSVNVIVGLNGTYPCLGDHAADQETIRIGQTSFGFRGMNLGK